ncbi:MAG: riboflavin synthase subunit alpha [Gammaproteobacteria bacterium]|nr:riboflavin synthase subunit alpha [Gammaproteobacteria bacterium]
MFTGIVQERAPVVSLTPFDGGLRLVLGLSAPRRAGLALGASVAVNGTCLTVTAVSEAGVAFDIIHETLRLTNLGALTEGAEVNVERSASFQDEIGGHRVSGHVSGTTVLKAISRAGGEWRGTMALDPTWSAYVFHKGFIALDGCSLTVARLDREAGTFEVALIPETLERTLWGQREAGAVINVEVDVDTQAIVTTLGRILKDPALRAQLLDGEGV